VRSQCRSAELSARETELQSVPSLNFELFRCYRVLQVSRNKQWTKANSLQPGSQDLDVRIALSQRGFIGRHRGSILRVL
jgi:hypothetical protein